VADLDNRHLGDECLLAFKILLCNLTVQKVGLVAVIDLPV